MTGVLDLPVTADGMREGSDPGGETGDEVPPVVFDRPRYHKFARDGEQETTEHLRSPSYTKLREDRCIFRYRLSVPARAIVPI